MNEDKEKKKDNTTLKLDTNLDQTWNKEIEDLLDEVEPEDKE